MIGIFKTLNTGEEKLREFDPRMTQRIKEGASLAKLIGEIETASRKCEYYAGNANANDVKRFFEEESKTLKKYRNVFQQYYESMTKE